jgi:hypothetical protein
MNMFAFTFLDTYFDIKLLKHKVLLNNYQKKFLSKLLY